MKKLFILILAGFIIIDIGTACYKKPADTVVEINVYNGSTAITGVATVSLYRSMADVLNNSPAYTQTVGDVNYVDITVEYLSKYYVVVTRGAAKNYYAGFLPIGIFQSQADINNSPAQTPAAAVGGVKFKDINGDGVINNSDKTDAPAIFLTKNATTYENVTIY